MIDIILEWRPRILVILPRLKTDFVKIITTNSNRLKKTKIEWTKKVYDNSSMFKDTLEITKNKLIKNLDKIKNSRNDIIFHAGTKILGNKIFLSVESFKFYNPQEQLFEDQKENNISN